MADLSSFAGSNLKFRFKYASNSSINNEGWYVDDVMLQWSGSCTTLPIPPGTVPDNDNYPGTPLTLAKAGTSLMLSWSQPLGNCNTEDYSIYRGMLPWIGYNHASVTCTTANATSYLIPSDSDSYYYLVVAQSSGNEGSYGLDSSNAQRPPSSSPCFVQSVSSCN
jgi:hypothetical protein